MDLLGIPVYNKNNPRQRLQSEIPVEIPTEITEKIKSPTIEQDNLVWFEKYRPVTFNEILGQTEIVNKIITKLNNLPHMILEGKAGIGKTTLVKVIANELNATLLELNSSDERGIEIIRGKVTNFIRHLSFNNSLKIVFFDEADSMTTEAQMSLRAIIEKHSSKTRFIFACNDINKIIDPLKSRCKVFRFNSIEPTDMKKRLLQIIEMEHIQITNVELDDIIEDSNGDFRKAINSLQMC